MDMQQQDCRMALFRAYDTKTCVNLFISDDYPLFPYALPKPVAYCKLGQYVITHVWDELEAGVVYRKVMFKFIYTSVSS